jgi:hypothetical protein
VALFVGLAFASYEFTRNWTEMFDSLSIAREEVATPVSTLTKEKSSELRPREDVGKTTKHSVDAVVAAVPVSSSSLESKTDEPRWLTLINHYRGEAEQHLVSANPILSDGDTKHSRYLVKNYSMVWKSGGTLGAAGHDEALDLPWSSPEGKKATQHSNIYFGCGPFKPDASVEWFMSAPFHRLQILSPNLLAVGYGSYVDKEGCWATSLALELGAEPPHRRSAIEFPADHTTTALRSVSGEWPDPLASCPGYIQPSGLPITLQLGWGTNPVISNESILRDGKSVEHCVFSGSNYRNPDPSIQGWGRTTLNSFGAITLIPREPLVSGASYTVSITTGERTYQWSFTVDRRVEENAGERPRS